MAALAAWVWAWAGAAMAEAPATSPRPPPRHAAGSTVVAVAPWMAAAVGVGARAQGEAEIRRRAQAPAERDTQAASGRGAPGAGVALAAAGAAEVPDTLAERASTSGALVSPRPLPRLGEAEAALLPGARRPPPRPAALVRRRNPAREVEVVQPASGLAVLRSPRPAARPENLARRAIVLAAAAAIPSQPDTGAITGRRGAVCGDRRLRGETLAPIAGRIRGCGVEDPVRITEVAGVRLSAPATVDCVTAGALANWVEGTVKPTVGRLGGGVAGLEVFAHYACRTRNNQAGARISEHGRGRAIDVGAIILKNGASIRVLEHWRDDQLGALLRAMHGGACGTFGTVLGPGADRFHQNHFHLDTARYRSGAFCR
ncbi:MAG: extensin family protein [Paracoccaceae bacterium]|nr:extensin family protein [Paracoccaceae bacterium]